MSISKYCREFTDGEKEDLFSLKKKYSKYNSRELRKIKNEQEYCLREIEWRYSRSDPFLWGAALVLPTFAISLIGALGVHAARRIRIRNLEKSIGGMVLELHRRRKCGDCSWEKECYDGETVSTTKEESNRGGNYEHKDGYDYYKGYLYTDDG